MEKYIWVMEFMDEEGDDFERESNTAYNSLREAKAALIKAAKGLNIQEWWIYDGEEICVDHGRNYIN